MQENDEESDKESSDEEPRAFAFLSCVSPLLVSVTLLQKNYSISGMKEYSQVILSISDPVLCFLIHSSYVCR